MAYGITQSLDLERSSSQYANISDASGPNLDFAGSFTLEAWIQLESAPGAGEYYTIISKGGISTAINDTTTQYTMIYNNDGANTLLFLLRATGSTKVASVGTTLNTGQWYHVAMTFEASTAMRVYLDGVEVATNTTSIPAATVNTARPFGIGTDNQTTPANFWDGKISLVRVWNTNRSQAEIEANMCNVFGGATTNMVGEWSFDNVYTDASGNGYTLTPSGSPVFSADVPTVCAAGGAKLFSLLGVGT